MVFFNVKAFNPNAKRYVNLDISKTYKLNEKDKKTLYIERIIETEHGSLTL